MFDWKDFIDLAKELLFKCDTTYKEANYRTVISRCYYGIFKQVEDYLESLGIPLPEEDRTGRKLGLHEKKIYFLQTHKDSNVRRFGDKLDRLKRLRKKADYTANISVTISEAKEAVKEATELFNRWLSIKTFLIN